MANMRRDNLEQGLLELHGRKTRTDTTMENRSAHRQKLREKILRQPERDDEKYTRPSVPKDMIPGRRAGLQDPGREERLAASQLRVENKRLEKEMDRQDSLHTLYMNARNFITTEDQLAAEIEKVFPEGENEAWRNDLRTGENIWNLGYPRGMSARLNESSSRNETARWDTIQGRVKKLGEQITGGKI